MGEVEILKLWLRYRNAENYTDHGGTLGNEAALRRVRRQYWFGTVRMRGPSASAEDGGAWRATASAPSVICLSKAARSRSSFGIILEFVDQRSSVIFVI